MRVEITPEEVKQISKAMLLAADHPDYQKVNWEIMAKFLAKIDSHYEDHT